MAVLRNVWRLATYGTEALLFPTDLDWITSGEGWCGNFISNHWATVVFLTLHVPGFNN